MTHGIDTADHVRHAPTGEDWVVAYVEGRKLCACGWPESLAELSDCTLVKKATAAERDYLLREMARGEGSRASYACNRLGLGGVTTPAAPTSDEPSELDIEHQFTAAPAPTKPLGVQFGAADSADFELGTWTFDMKGSENWQVTAGEFAIMPKDHYRANEALEAENAKLRDALADKVSAETLLTELNMQGSGINMRFEGGAAGILAQSFVSMFGKHAANNYIELSFDSKLGPIMVTVQRRDKKTPHMLRMEAEAELERLRGGTAPFVIELTAVEAGALMDLFDELKQPEMTLSVGDNGDGVYGLFAGPTNHTDEVFKLIKSLKMPAPPGEQRAMLEQAAQALDAALNEVARNVCTHEETKRGGAIWTICCNCDMKWADDQGGFQPYAEPPRITAAHQTLATIRASLAS